MTQPASVAADRRVPIGLARGPSASPSSANDRSFPELDCLRGRLPESVLAAAETRAERVGIGADRVLIASSAIGEEEYVRALAVHLAVPFVPLDGTPRADCLLADDRMIAMASLGLSVLVSGERPVTLVAPRRLGARHLSRMLAGHPERARHWRFTTSERLTRFVLRGAGATLAEEATNRLKRRSPELSAARRSPRRRRWSIVTAGCFAFAVFAPGVALDFVELSLGAMFLGWLALRFAGATLPAHKPARLPRVPDASLPIYTVVAALYREAASVNDLLHAVAQLDYPPEKLDVILAVEAGDAETRAAIAARTARIPVTVIVVPAGALRTKPRALNAALHFAQGAFTVVFDAEDRPEPEQLRRALAAFAAGGDRLACVQARLTIDNTDDSWLARLFTAEYAAHFDVFLDGIAALRLPLPLGGSSNHFRTAVLRQVGGWDAYNVTEDADLGLRLARLGFRTEMIASSTHEEAPATLGRWLPQRTRWMKGWMQTWVVHMRDPRRLWRELGPRGFLAVQLVIGGNVLAALIHPLFLTGLGLAFWNGYAPWQSDEGTVLVALYLINLLAGYLGSGVLGWIGLSRRGLSRIAWVLVATPIHWMLLSAAAWRALWQFAFAPHVWEKTEHGLARHSRRHQRLTAALLALEAEVARVRGAADRPTAARAPTA